MITRTMIKNGYEKGIIKLESSPHNDGIVARIGEYCLYFEGLIAEQYNDPNTFKEDLHNDIIIDKIWDVLNEFKKDEAFQLEYDYYEAILEEAGCDK